MVGDLPVEAVGPEIHEAAALFGVSQQGIRHRLRGVFGMAARDDAIIRLQQGLALQMQRLVGHDIVGKSVLLQPVEDQGVGAEVPHARARLHAEHRPVARGVTHAAAVAVTVVGRGAQLRMHLQVHLGPGQGGEAVHRPLQEAPHLHMGAVIAVTDIGRGRHQHRQPGTRLSPGRQDVEGGVGGPAAQVDTAAVDAARPVRRNRQRNVVLPAAVDDIVLVEVDGAVVVGVVGPAVRAGVPAAAPHGAGRLVDDAAVPGVG